PAGASAAPVPDRRYPADAAQAAPPQPSVSFGVPVGVAPTRGSSFTERDPNPDAQAQQRASRLPAPGFQLRLPVR
ncbi:MAG: hypothetical protein K2X11_23005, partial [Acetobacteraceae bacterium]|nr:hypothetical protein [Acetobacteraceae bacterium]